MDPLLIVAFGFAVVVSGLLLRLHPFLPLLAGALLVASLSSPAKVLEAESARFATRVVGKAEGNEYFVLRSSRQTLRSGLYFVEAREALLPEPVEIEVLESGTTAGLTRIRCVRPLPEGTTALIPANRIEQARQLAKAGPGERVTRGFGNTAGSIGIMVALAAIIGECLLASGAADRIVWSIRSAAGDRFAAQGFIFTGFLLGIPVFFDTVFYLLLPLARALYQRTHGHWVLYVLSVVAGATMAHSLVPPTPGPLLVAGELGVSIGLMMIGGTVVGLAATSVGYLYALWADRRWPIEMKIGDSNRATSIPRSFDEAACPPLWMSLLPIIVPVVLIGSVAMLDLRSSDEPDSGWQSWLRYLGDKNIALGIACALAWLLVLRGRRMTRQEAVALTQKALVAAGSIILITSAGGAFGAVLQQTGVASVLARLFPLSSFALLPLAFLLTATIRIAQGSATVAMITSVGIVAPMVVAREFAFHPLYVALAIGCGSKPIPWLNDSGFWVISQMAGFTEVETLKTASVMMSLMGLVGLLVTMLGAWLIPFV
jgi:GntP family gluconate:H+ symporter